MLVVGRKLNKQIYPEQPKTCQCLLFIQYCVSNGISNSPFELNFKPRDTRHAAESFSLCGYLRGRHGWVQYFECSIRHMATPRTDQGH